ncbi:DUF6296 family protein [Kitasatospora herbaricolor]|uniref:DUF6296 family protein n=1 Tax=Kitasatospora herbaricolor TaxID=68217 RepID=A0ABZ1W241_9ACTN|nr:DUF6296 family protein [Kitasatospora herbaricolor]
MEPAQYAVVLPGTPGTHGLPEVVTVRMTRAVGEEGLPVFEDETGTVRVEIIAPCVARPLSGTAAAALHTCLLAEPLSDRGPRTGRSVPAPVVDRWRRPPSARSAATVGDTDAAPAEERSDQGSGYGPPAVAGRAAPSP